VTRKHKPVNTYLIEIVAYKGWNSKLKMLNFIRENFDVY